MTDQVLPVIITPPTWEGDRNIRHTYTHTHTHTAGSAKAGGRHTLPHRNRVPTPEPTDLTIL